METAKESDVALAEGRTLTRQEAFDAVWRHAVIDKAAPGYNPKTGNCAYRGANNTCCFIGYLMPDAFYRPNMDFMGSVHGILSDNEIEKSLSVLFDLNSDTDFYSALQRVHDGLAEAEDTHYREHIEGALRLFANEQSLLIPGETLDA